MFELRQVEAADHSDERTAASISLRNQIRMTEFYCQMFVLKKNKPKTNSLNVYISPFSTCMFLKILRKRKNVLRATVTRALKPKKHRNPIPLLTVPSTSSSLTSWRSWREQW